MKNFNTFSFFSYKIPFIVEEQNNRSRTSTQPTMKQGERPLNENRSFLDIMYGLWMCIFICLEIYMYTYNKYILLDGGKRVLFMDNRLA